MSINFRRLTLKFFVLLWGVLGFLILSAFASPREQVELDGCDAVMAHENERLSPQLVSALAQTKIQEVTLSSPSSSVAELNSDSILIARCKAGDEQAWNVLVKKYEGRIFRYAHQLAGNYDDASELVGEVFLKLFSNLNTFREESSFGTWIFRVTFRTFLDMKGKASRRPWQSLDRVEGGSDDSLMDRNNFSPKGELENKIISEEAHRILVRAILQLPKDSRTVLVLYHLESYPYEDIAVIIGKPIGTVKSRINRARGMLKERLAPWMSLFQ